LDCGHDFGMAVARRHYRYAGSEVQEGVTVSILDQCT
jgi:hypothetical protein